MLSTDDLGAFFAPHHTTLAGELASLAASFGQIEDDGALALRMGRECDLYRFFVDEHVDLRAICLVREMLGYQNPVADSIFAVHGLGTYPVRLTGSGSQKERYLGPCRAGDKIAGFALTEPEAGSDVAAMSTRAERDGDAYVLSGEKTFISNVGVASHFVVFANADPEAGRKGITAFLVDGDTAGLSQEPIVLGAPHPIGRLRFAGCRIPATSRLGEEGHGFKLAMSTLDTFRVSVAAAACGMARRALDETLHRVKERRQFGKPLAEQQLVQSYIADMATELDAARLLTYRAAHARDEGGTRVTREAAMAKLFATEAAQRIIDKAVQLHGGLGVTAGVAVEHLYRAIRPLRIYEGTSEIQKLIIARELLR